MNLTLPKREIAEFAILFAVAYLFKVVYVQQFFSVHTLIIFITLWAFLKSIYFVFENSIHLLVATSQDIAYHKFLFLMTYNIGQMTLSFAVDFFCLYEVDKNSFIGVAPEFSKLEEAFEFFYFSVLNFTFFGYGDLMPNTIATKIVLLMEVIIAFLTIIFILSDFISMKDSLRKK
ncbi:ion transport 2 domain protein [Emticicia oligotrophica DSM 17448]|uniref:Ion transport 2 domain protein n=1 Tax=Emticicia oligotrophica (strain DSM 17448 / CIP 109782 / MTCC 6937 / GPTSA100-15) TaxID=929562 RepID=A0ABN4ASQ5_EMTOG|nr:MULTISPECIES: ion channel [Emticicia]AFK04780.1 ion transport 2 domain protein [Emticicia oligotrophica DSM 17448]